MAPTRDPPTKSNPRSHPADKGGEFHGESQPWGRRGFNPPKHIPWPQIFKHHISLVEGHLKMIDMVRKHTVEGTTDHRQICDMIESTETMLYETKKISRNCAPPPNQRKQGPPGSSPADSIHGEAASEAETWIAAARAQGVYLKPASDVECETEQNKPAKRTSLAEIKTGEAPKEDSGGGPGSGTDAPQPAINGHSDQSKPTEDTTKDSKPGQAALGTDQQAFFIDTQPTPVDLPFATKKASKRSSPEQALTEGSKPKKVKQKHEGSPPAPPAPGQIEREDITAEVDARMKEKEARRKRKVEKKRKRDSEELTGVLGETVNEATKSDKPKKKKLKRDGDAKGSEGPSKKRLVTEEGLEDGKEDKKTKRKKHKVTV